MTELTRKGLDDFSLRCLSNGSEHRFRQIHFGSPVAVRKQLASAVCILGSAAAFMLQHGDGIPKIPRIWAHTLMSLVLLFHFGAPGSLHQVDSHRSRLLHKLQQFGVHPDIALLIV